MSAERDDRFEGTLKPGRLSPDEVELRLRRAVDPERSGSTRLDLSLAALDAISASMVPRGRLLAGLRSPSGEAAWLFSLNVHGEVDRLRNSVAIAHRRAWQYSDLIADRLEELGIAEEFQQDSLALWQIHRSLRRKFHDSPDQQAALNKLMMEYFRLLGPSAFADSGDTHLDDLLAENGAGLGSFENPDFTWLMHLEAVGLDRGHPLFFAALGLVPDPNDEGGLVIDEERAAAFPNQEIAAALKERLAPRLLAVAIRRRGSGVKTTKRGAMGGVVELDAIDFFILQLAEIYALSFGRPVPTYFDLREHRENQRDKHFAGFLQAAAGACDVPVGSWETRIRHWRRFPIVKDYLAALARLGSAVGAGDAPPFLLDEDLHLVTTWVLRKAPAALWAGG